MNELTKADLVQIGDDEPRILDLRVAERLGFTRPVNIRNLIRRNEAELVTYGDLLRDEANSKTGPGRPSDGYLLNEGQILLLAMKSDAPNAVAIRKEVITVYQAWRRGEVAGGITKADLLAMEARFDAKLALAAEKIAFIAEAYDPTKQRGVTHRPTVYFLQDQKVPQKGRRGLTIKVSKELLQLAVVTGDLSLIRMENEHKGRWLFHVDLFARWFGDGGSETIRAHKDAIAGQAVMKFTVVPKSDQ
jgi:hypothetical protein